MKNVVEIFRASARAIPAIGILIFSWSTATAQNGPSGLLVSKSTPSPSIKIIPFKDISWVGNSGGTVAGMDGRNVIFMNDAVAKIVYLDEGLWKRLNGDLQPVYRAPIYNLEVHVSVNRSTIVTEAENAALSSDKLALENVIRDVPESKAVLSPALASLGLEAGRFQAGERRP